MSVKVEFPRKGKVRSCPLTPPPPTVVLPDREEMSRRLASLHDLDHVVERFHPILLQSAGRELNGMGVVMMLTLAIHDYTEGMPTMMSNIMFRSCPKYIDVLVDDKTVKADAKEFLETVLKPS